MLYITSLKKCIDNDTDNFFLSFGFRNHIFFLSKTWFSIPGISVGSDFIFFQPSNVQLTFVKSIDWKLNEKVIFVARDLKKIANGSRKSTHNKSDLLKRLFDL